jgi:hypothetical protein
MLFTLQVVQQAGLSPNQEITTNLFLMGFLVIQFCRSCGILDHSEELIRAVKSLSMASSNFDSIKIFRGSPQIRVTEVSL